MVEPQYSSVPTNDIIWIAANNDAKREAPNAHRHRFVFTFWRRCMTSAALCLLTAYLVHTYDKTIINKRLSSTQQKEFLNDPKPSAPWPRIAWLMSFPNSVSAIRVTPVATVVTSPLWNQKVSSPLCFSI